MKLTRLGRATTLGLLTLGAFAFGQSTTTRALTPPPLTADELATGREFTLPGMAVRVIDLTGSVDVLRGASPLESPRMAPGGSGSPFNGPSTAGALFFEATPQESGGAEAGRDSIGPLNDRIYTLTWSGSSTPLAIETDWGHYRIVWNGEASSVYGEFMFGTQLTIVLTDRGPRLLEPALPLQ